MIKVNTLTKSFDGFKALDELSMHARKGSIYGLVGPNGAGKSTLLRHVTGIYQPDSGTVLVDGERVYENPPVKQKMFFIPDDPYHFPASSTRDMMRFYQGLYPRFSQTRYEALREAFPDVKEKTPIRRLSRGMQKQSAFWLALCCQPELLVLDEPVDGLDPVMRRQVWSLLMGDVAQRGMTVLISSHNLRELEDVCDHVGILSAAGALAHGLAGQYHQDTARVPGAGPAGAAGRPERTAHLPAGPGPHPDRPWKPGYHSRAAVHAVAAVHGGAAPEPGGDLYL